MSAPTVVASAVADSTQYGSAPTFGVPGAASADSAVLLFISCPDTATLAQLNGPQGDGWQYLGGYGQQNGPPTGEVWLRPRQAAAPASTYHYTKPNGIPSAWSLLVIDGTDPAAPIAVELDIDGDGDNTDTMPAPSITLPSDDCLLINGAAATPYASGSSDDQFSAAPAGSDGSVQTVTTEYQSHMLAWDTPGAGATGPRTFTFGDTGSAAGPGAIYWSLALQGLQATGSDQTATPEPVYTTNVVPGGSITVDGEVPVEARTTPVSLAERTAMHEALEIEYELSRLLVLSELGHVEGDVVTAVQNGQVEYNATGPIHRVFRCDLTEALDWGRQRVQPWVRMTGGGWTDEVPLGVFCMTAPEPEGGRRPALYSVLGYDKVYLLDHELGSTLSLPAGEPILGAVRELLALRGFGDDFIDASRAGDVLPEARTWAPEQGGITYIKVINELLSMVGYEPLWVDRRGNARSAPAVPAHLRRIAWLYSTERPTTSVHIDGQKLSDDYTDRRNRWRFVRNTTDTDDRLVEGDGIYVFDNAVHGPSSQQARGGLVIPRNETLEAATHDDLVAQGNKIIAEDIYAATTVTISSRLNPYHDHRDTLELIVGDLGVGRLVEQVGYTHDLEVFTTSHTATTLERGVYA